MMKWNVCATLASGGFVVLLAACSHPPLPPPAPVPPAVSPTAMVEAIRAAKANDNSVVEIKPLRDPAVDGYLDGARADEAAGQYRAALDKLDAALKLSPGAPDLLQFRAEAEILLREFPAADADARKSWSLGPRVGGLCASNWQTVLEVAKASRNDAGVADARAKRKACHKPPPPSF